MATVEAGNRNSRVRVYNVSRHGALIAGDALPCENEQVIFHCNMCTVRGNVAWARAPLAGIQFDEEVGLEDLLRVAPQHTQAITKDMRKVDFRRPGFRGNQLTAEEKQAVEDWIHGGEKPFRA